MNDAIANLKDLGKFDIRSCDGENKTWTFVRGGVAWVDCADIFRRARTVVVEGRPETYA